MKFPKNFVWGTATSAYQIEGAWNEAGKGPSIWDEFSHTPGRIYLDQHGDVACDHYHKIKEDVALMKQMGVNAYRFSISWSRILPTGKGHINYEGIEFYNRLIDELKEHEIEPWITLYHWDLPAFLHREGEGWLKKEIVEHFTKYAEICFEHFGDRVKNWITFNEPWVVAILGYGQGVFAPGHISNVEPYLVGHHILLAHAASVKVYRDKFQNFQKGRIGISNNCDWREPLTQKKKDRDAAQRALEFFFAWFVDPIVFGDYPEVMKTRLKERLPQFSKEESNLLIGSTDFLGLNHYTTMYASHSEEIQAGNVYGNGGLSEDQDVNLSLDDSWELTEMQWAVVPWGCQKMLEWIADRYKGLDIYITENGCAGDDVLEQGEVYDPKRIEFIKSYLEACNKAIQNGVPLKGYFAWSFMDNFEWASGYSKRFGLHFVDYQTLERTPKASAFWFKEFLKVQMS